MGEDNYYHAGTMTGNGEVRWSDSTRRSSSTAEDEARRMAAEFGGMPVVEHWHRSHGLRPGDASVVSGSYFVTTPGRNRPTTKEIDHHE